MRTKLGIRVGGDSVGLYEIEPGTAFIDNEGDLILAFEKPDDNGDWGVGYLLLHPGVNASEVSKSGMEEIGVRRIVRELQIVETGE